MNQILIIPETPQSLNTLLRINRWVREKYRKEIAELIGWLCKSQKIKPVKNPVILQFIVTFNNKHRHDYDNYLGGAKYIIDGLKEAGIFPDDNSKVITAINMSFKIGRDKETKIEIIELT